MPLISADQLHMAVPMARFEDVLKYTAIPSASRITCTRGDTAT
jgi:hypothetical protein